MKKGERAMRGSGERGKIKKKKKRKRMKKGKEEQAGEMKKRRGKEIGEDERGY
jgi:hypothetical protein